MGQLPAPGSSQRNGWAILSLVSGLLGLLLALTAPIPFVPIISIFNWPLGLIALLAAWVARRQASQFPLTGTAASQARWGVRLGCAGWTFQFIVSTIKVVLIAGFLSYLLGTTINTWLATATPVP